MPTEPAAPARGPTEVLHVDARWPDAGVIQRAATVLRAGGLVAFPTETVYGLGGLALDAAVVRTIFAAKGRPARNPVIVHVADVAAVLPLVGDWPERAALLAANFWPGPLTLVLPRSERVPDVVTAGGPTVAVRVPVHPVALALLQACGLPIAAPSANRSTSISPTQGEHVLRTLEDRIDLLLDAGATPGGLESTVVDVSRSTPRLLRPGLVTRSALETIIGPVELANDLSQEETLPAPGMMARHYAPRTPLELAGAEFVRQLREQVLRVGWITIGPEPTIPGVVQRDLPADPVGYAAHLYAALHELDDLGLDRLVVTPPPETEAWLAVRDRLRRASAPSTPGERSRPRSP